MASKSVEQLKQKMNQKAKAEASESSSRKGDSTADRDVAAGPKTMAEKQVAAEEIIASAKALDVEDSREETSGDERHDLVIPTMPNIPPSIVTERLKMGQNPQTGEPWTREDRIRYDRENEQATQDHARAVRESELKMRQEQAESPIQPVPHVPISQLTQGQLKAQQEAQDAGKGPVAQARARDANSPEELGKAEAMTKHDQQREDAGVDEDIEKKELGEDIEEFEAEEKKDADEEQADLERKSKR